MRTSTRAAQDDDIVVLKILREPTPGGPRRFVWQVRRGAQIVARSPNEAAALQYASDLASAEQVNAWLIDEPACAMLLVVEHRPYVH